MSKRIVVPLVVVGLFVLIGALAYRPAAFIGVQAGALAHSVRDDGNSDRRDVPTPEKPGNCQQREDDVWNCQAPRGSVGTTDYAVKTRSLGCWDAWRGEKTPGTEDEISRSGCINGLDFALGD